MENNVFMPDVFEESKFGKLKLFWVRLFGKKIVTINMGLTLTRYEYKGVSYVTDIDLPDVQGSDENG